MNRLFALAIWEFGRRTVVVDDEQEPQIGDDCSDDSADQGQHIDSQQSRQDSDSENDNSSSSSALIYDEDEWLSFLPKGFVNPYRKFAEPRKVTKAGYVDKVAYDHRQWRGKEPGSEVSVEFLSFMLAEQMDRWAKISKVHIDLVLKATRAFVDDVFESFLAIHSEVQTNLKSDIIDPRFQKLEESVRQKLEEVISCYTTESHAFLDVYMKFTNVTPVAANVDNHVDLIQELANWYKSSVHEMPNRLLESVVSALHTAITKSGGLSSKDGSLEKLHKMLTDALPPPILTLLNFGHVEHRTTSPLKFGSELEAAYRATHLTEECYRVSIPFKFTHGFRILTSQMNVFGFVGYVNALIVQGRLVQGLRNEIFTFDIIDNAERHIIQNITKESEETSTERRELKFEIEEVENVSKELKSYSVSDTCN
jgi:hypothetical protein